MIEVTVVFKRDDEDTIHFKVSGTLSIAEIKLAVLRRYSGVAYVAIGIDN